LYMIWSIRPSSLFWSGSIFVDIILVGFVCHHWSHPVLAVPLTDLTHGYVTWWLLGILGCAPWGIV
jgi:hypothetical protein